MKKNYFINLCFFLYFIILMCERFASLIISIINGKGLFFTTNVFDIVSYCLIYISLIGGVFYIVYKLSNEICALFKKERANEINYTNLLNASMILLVSGMMHSHYTTSVVQFISYGFLIIACIIKVVCDSKNKTSIISLIYLTTFAMAIPVCYDTNISIKYLFYVVEFITTLTLIYIYFKELKDLFENKAKLNLVNFLIFVFSTTLVILLRINEKLNTFVLIFEIATIIVFAIGVLITRNKKTN